jgi:hypothetical protein
MAHPTGQEKGNYFLAIQRLDFPSLSESKRHFGLDMDRVDDPMKQIKKCPLLADRTYRISCISTFTVVVPSK